MASFSKSSDMEIGMDVNYIEPINANAIASISGDENEPSCSIKLKTGGMELRNIEVPCCSKDVNFESLEDKDKPVLDFSKKKKWKDYLEELNEVSDSEADYFMKDNDDTNVMYDPLYPRRSAHSNQDIRVEWLLDTKKSASSHTTVASFLNITPKPVLNKESEFVGIVSYVNSPTEFYITLESINARTCSCKKADDWETKFKEVEEDVAIKIGKRDEIDEYYICGPDLESDLSSIPSEEDLLHSFLKKRYKQFQRDEYLPDIELVAVRVDLMWRRGIVLLEYPKAAESNTHEYQVQLIDSGEKLTVDSSNMCYLPEMFGYSPAKAYKCCLFGISPNWMDWSANAVSDFIGLVYKKKIRMIVKEGPKDDDKKYKIIENRPYIVKIIVESDDDDVIDITQHMIEKGYGMKWNPFPYRPCVRKVIDTRGHDLLRQLGPPSLPKLQLDKEGSGHTWQKTCEELKENESDSPYSGSPPEKSTNTQIRRVEQMNKVCEEMKVTFVRLKLEESTTSVHEEDNAEPTTD